MGNKYFQKVREYDIISSHLSNNLMNVSFVIDKPTCENEALVPK